MKYVNLGRSGLKVSRLCLGCMSYGEPERLPQPWSLDEKASRPLIRQALEAGINFLIPRISTRLDPIYHDATAIQPALPGRRARDAAPV